MILRLVTPPDESWGPCTACGRVQVCTSDGFTLCIECEPEDDATPIVEIPAIVPLTHRVKGEAPGDLAGRERWLTTLCGQIARYGPDGHHAGTALLEQVNFHRPTCPECMRVLTERLCEHGIPHTEDCAGCAADLRASWARDPDA